jgi:hypothetical protein
MNWKLPLAASGMIALLGVILWRAVTRGPLSPASVALAPVREGNIDSSVFGVGTVEEEGEGRGALDGAAAMVAQSA